MRYCTGQWDVKTDKPRRQWNILHSFTLKTQVSQEHGTNLIKKGWIITRKDEIFSYFLLSQSWDLYLMVIVLYSDREKQVYKTIIGPWCVWQFLEFLKKMLLSLLASLWKKSGEKLGGFVPETKNEVRRGRMWAILRQLILAFSFKGVSGNEA